MIKLYNFDELRPEEILNRDIRAEKNVEDVVAGIIAEVRARGDEALKEYALKFDGAKIDDLQVTQAEIDEAFANMDPYFLETLREAAANIESFHRQQVHKNFVINEKPGIVLGQKYTPIEKVGVYVPAARRLSLYRADGCHPGQGRGRVGDRDDHPRRKGRQGESGHPCRRRHRRCDQDLQDRRCTGRGRAGLRHPEHPAVDKIVGPGNIYVATAKRKVFGKVGIDMIAGPARSWCWPTAAATPPGWRQIC